jgi:hypothetical protein
MMGTREKLIGGGECDALSRRARRVHRWVAGEVAKIKAKFWRRTRRNARLAITREIY